MFPGPPLALAAALLLDRLGEPPAVLHPVVWIGRALAASGAPWPKREPAAAFTLGATAWLAGAATVVAGAVLAVRILERLQVRGTAASMVAALLLALLLKPLFAWRMLYLEVRGVGETLERDGIQSARIRLSRLVSRDTRRLSATQIRESALESLAENFNDSLVAPVFWFVVGGLPAAALYRFANTADAMWGYRGPWEWAGKWAARADDVLSYVPARLAALLLALAAGRVPRGLAAVARVTPSPNGGWPMGALALLLGVQLTKPGVYALNPGAAPVDAERFTAGLGLCARAAAIAALVALAVLLAAARW